MKRKFLLIVSFVIGFTIICSCSRVTTTTPLYNDKCPFRMLNFTASTDKDSVKNTLAINDTLVASLQADLALLKKNGKVGNNLIMSINRYKANSSTRTLDVSNEYYQLFNNKTTALCGLNDILLRNKTLRSADNRQKAEALFINMVASLSDYGEKKKQEISTLK